MEYVFIYDVVDGMKITYCPSLLISSSTNRIKVLPVELGIFLEAVLHVRLNVATLPISYGCLK